MEYYWVGHKKERCTDTYYNMDEPWKHYAKWKKPVTKYSIYMKCAETGKFAETESRLVVAKGWGWVGVEK